MTRRRHSAVVVALMLGAVTPLAAQQTTQTPVDRARAFIADTMKKLGAPGAQVTVMRGGKVVEKGTADQIFDVAQVVHHVSQFLALEAGDLVLTGTPEGVALSGRFPYLTSDDVVEVEIDSLGRQRQVVVPFATAVA